MSNDDERIRILGMIESGLITADEGIVLLKALAERSQSLPETASSAGEPADVSSVASADGPSADDALPVEPVSSTNLPPADSAASQDRAGPEEAPSFDESSVSEEPLTPEEPPLETPRSNPGMDRFRSWWWIPMWVGVFITVIGATFMFLSYRSGGLGFWFACSWFPFLLGVLVLALAWSSRTARWLHVRVHQKEGERPQNINISLPIPLHLTAWFVRTFGDRIPGINNTGLDEVILALAKTSPDTPFYVQVDEGENGEKVEVYIG